MENITSFLGMGGYAVYVWPSFVFTSLMMLARVIGSVRSLRRAEKALKQLQHEA
jgi:heme exporter protein D